MASVNKVIIIGHLGEDPDLRYTESNTAITKMSVATSERYKDKQGNQQEKVEWHRIVVFGKQAEHCNQYLAKGRQVYIEGRIQTRKYQDKQGNDRYTTEIVAQNVTFLSGGNEGRAPQQRQSNSRGGGGYNQQFDNDDLPF